MKKQKTARLMLIVAMAIFGTIGLFVQHIGVSSGELALYRAVMATILIGLYLIITGNKISFQNIKKDVPLLLASGMAMGINWILLFEAYKHTTVLLTTLTYYFAPVIVTVVCPILFKEKMTVKQIICFIMSTLGIVMITGIGDLTVSGTNIIGILFALGAAILYATVILINKFIKGVEGIHRTFLQFLAAIIILVPYVAVTSGINLRMLDSIGWGALLIVGIVHTGITYCLYFSALKDLPGQNVAMLSYIDPLVAIIVSVTFLNESMTVIQAIGGVLILGFTFLNEVKSS